MKPSKGFTTLELAIALAMMAIVVAIALTSYISLMPRYRLSGAASQLSSDLIGARMKAVKLSSRVQVFLGVQEYKVCDDADQNGAVGANEGDVRVFDLNVHYPGVSLASAGGDLIFHPRGTAVNMVTVTLSNSSGLRQIQVNIAGRVQQL
jgi:type IV fimbrial biogenesis protein FimT